MRNEAGYEEYELDASNKDFAIVALDLLSGLGTVIHRISIVTYSIIVIHSVKPFNSKNRDKIYLDAANPNMKKGSDEDFRATT